MPIRGDYIELSGQTFGRLTVIEFSHRSPNRQSNWVCRCSCGKTATVCISSLRNGDTRSCGCIRRSQIASRNVANTRHGHLANRRISPEYHSWRAMLTRCSLSANSQDLKNYYNRGIRVCDRWLKFENFLADMGPRPAGKSLDRYPKGDGNYEPGNCRWATPKQQAETSRHPGRVPGVITVAGVTATRRLWAKAIGLSLAQVNFLSSKGRIEQTIIKRAVLRLKLDSMVSQVSE
jgi:hypothetical protein